MASWANGFLKIPNPILSHPALSPIEKILFSIVLSYAHNGKLCALDYSTLAEMTGVSESQIDKVLRSLEQKNLIVRERNDRDKRRRYLAISETAPTALAQMAREAKRDAV